MRTPALATVMAVTLAIFSAPTALAAEDDTTSGENDYSTVELSLGEPISIPRGHDVGFIEENHSFDRTLRSANTAQSCIQAKVEKLAVQVYNNCDSDMRIKVIITANTSPIIGAKETNCNTITPGTRANVRWIVHGNEKIDKVEFC